MDRTAHLEKAGMDEARYRRMKDVFAAALERPVRDRETFVQAACKGDVALLTDVESLLDAHSRAGSFLSPTQTPSLETETAILDDPYIDVLLKGRYHIGRVLGKGGFGMVYLARDTHLHDKLSVIKIIRHEGLFPHGDRSDIHDWLRKKFRDESEALARINHPGIVGVLDEGETPDGLPFLVLDYVEGSVLRSQMDPAGMALDRVANLLRQIGQALNAAHNHGVCHRDLKPENIMLRNLGEGLEFPVIIDFGLASVTHSGDASSAHTRVAGSYPYMAPEQLAGRPEPASDIFALGVIAFEMLTGRHPFGGASPIQQFAVQKADPAHRPRELRPDLPIGAERALLKALSFDPRQRHRRATEFTEELAQALTCGVHKRAAAPFAGSRRWAAVAIVIIAIAGALAAAYWVRKQNAARTVAASVASQQPTLSYYVMVQKFRSGRPYQEPFRMAGEMLFPADYGIRLVFSGSQPGYLYLVNEAPLQRDGLPSYNVLFPSPAANNGSPLLAPGQEVPLPAAGGHFIFDEQQGEEKVWIVWAREPVPQIESVKHWANPRDRGTIKDAAQAQLVQQFFVRHAPQSPQIERDERGRRTVLRVQHEPMVNLLKLQHH